MNRKVNNRDYQKAMKDLQKSHRSCFNWITVFILVILPVTIFAKGNMDTLQLTSPKNDDHFEVAKPLFYWKTIQGVKKYAVFIDNAEIDRVKAESVAIQSYGIKLDLSAGMHKWFIKGILPSGNLVTSATYAFTIDLASSWPEWAIGPFQRYSENPILRPAGTGWESRNAYNPGVLFDQGRFRMLYRGQGNDLSNLHIHVSRTGYAESTDGINFKRDEKPIIDATESFEQKFGCEDARFYKYKSMYYTFYTGNNVKGGIALCEATSTNGHDWKKLGIAIDNTKNGALLSDPNGNPVRVNGKFVMYLGNSQFGICYSDNLINWGPVAWINMNLPPNWVKPFEPCIAVTNHSVNRPDDIVLFIAGTLNGKGKWFYAISEVLFSKKDPAKKADQLNDCIMKPQELYESGEFKNCIWMNSIIQHNGQWMMYYGAGDRNIGLATAYVK